MRRHPLFHMFAIILFVTGAEEEEEEEEEDEDFVVPGGF